MWLILVVGCRSPEVAAFLDDRAAAICARHARCGTLDDAGYGAGDDTSAPTEADCLDAVDAATGALADDGALGCGAFDAAAADECLAAYADAPCDAAPDLSACDAVCTEATPASG